jgi:hypothetical protein
LHTVSRFQRLVAVAAIAGLLLLLLAVPVRGTAAWIRVLQDAAHGPIFAAITIALWFLFAPTAARRESAAFWTRRRDLLAFAGAQAIGLAVELTQDTMGRPASVFDLGSNAAGAALGLAMIHLYRRRPGPAPRRPHGAGAWVLGAAAAAGLVYLAWRPVVAASAYLQRARDVPVLASFRAPRDLYFVHTRGTASGIVDLPARWAREDGERALRVRYDAAHGPAVQLTEPWEDWRGYEVLVADLTNAGARDLRLVLRVLDARHDWSPGDRLNLPIVVPALTRARVRVSLDAVRSAPQRRPMDLSRIADVMLFAAPAAEGDLYVSRIWLE